MKARRLFAGVEVEATERLREFAAELKREWAGARIRWTRPENLHLTVEFFGETAEDEIPRLEAALAKAAGETPEARAFAPHLTLGRIERLKDVRRFAETVARRREWSAGKQAARELILFESAAGRYVPLARWPLGKPRDPESK